MTSGWGWRRTRAGGRRWTSLTFSASGVAVPWITLVILLLLLRFLGGTMTSSDGILFDLPENGLSEGETTDLVALVLAMPNGTLVFFDDARYTLADGSSSFALGEHLGECVRQSGQTSLLVLADRNVGAGDLMNLATVARLNGVKRVLIANKSAEGRTE